MREEPDGEIRTSALPATMPRILGLRAMDPTRLPRVYWTKSQRTANT
jgi:hypothetical protein